MGKITKVRLPDHIEAKLASGMGKMGIGPHDKNAVISRCVEMYLEFADMDKGLKDIISQRREARSRKGKQIWQKSQEPKPIACPRCHNVNIEEKEEVH